jgi:hypothetical protein
LGQKYYGKPIETRTEKAIRKREGSIVLSIRLTQTKVEATPSFNRKNDAAARHWPHRPDEPGKGSPPGSAGDILQKVIRANSRLSSKQNATLH